MYVVDDHDRICVPESRTYRLGSVRDSMEAGGTVREKKIRASGNSYVQVSKEPKCLVTQINYVRCFELTIRAIKVSQVPKA